jgi:superfamily II DNA or RNA helicase
MTTAPASSSPARRFLDLDLDIHYEGPGEELLIRFVVPVLQAAASYDRLTSFFSVSSLLAIAQGIESLWRRQGAMRLILGVHDVPPELAQAAAEDIPDLVVAEVRQRLLDQISTLSDELSRDRLATLAWMMQDGLLHVRVAAPASSRSTSVDGVFHSKRFIFRDAEGSTVSAVGSPNETVLGLGANFEEIDVHMSWQDPLGYVSRHTNSFERIWSGDHEGLRVVELDESFAIELLASLGDPSRPTRQEAPGSARKATQAEALLNLARRSPAWAVFNLTTAALYPHQERVFLDALGRWPIRVLLADEVGLGKTLEAGIVIAYARRFLGLRRVTILAPAGLLRQWQDEMRVHFDLDFWRYESASRAYLSSQGAVRTVLPGVSPLGAHAPGLTLISSQLARGNRRSGHIFDGVEVLPEMLVVDEAHSARVRLDLDGTSRPTLMWGLVNDVKERIPHVVFLTATPMQLDPSEYHSMLELLGLPDWWAEPGRLEAILDLLASPNSTPELQPVRDALSGIASTMSQMRPDLERFGMTESERAVLHGVEDTAHAGAGSVVAAQNRWPDVYSTLVKTHPGHLLTIRNTRASLSSMGYSFPERRFDAPPLLIDEAVADFYSMTDAYLESAFGRVEAALHPEKRNSLGFLRSTYRQRLASSLRAAEISLGRRVARIESILEGIPAPADEPDEMDTEWEDGTENEPAIATEVAETTVLYACRVELGYLRDLVRQLEDLDVEDLGRDPKLDMLMNLIGRHLAAGDQVLVFSRYTDTVDACVELFLDRHMEAVPPPHAKYTGGASWIDSGSGPLPATKEAIREALDRAEISVVFCSDAASEGLNMQAARVIINVDVPWNPARLEQRIGRIARLGQKASEVDIYNLWYPDSVEAKIYDRLLRRRDLYELAVGEFPEIVGSAIRNELSARYATGAAAITDDPIALLNTLRENQQRIALGRIWQVELSDSPESQGFRERLAGLISRAGETPPSVHPGDSDVLSLHHPALDAITNVGPSSDPGTDDIFAVLADDVAIGFAIADGDEFVLVPPEALPALLAWLAFGDRPVADDSWVRVQRSSIAKASGGVVLQSRWTPDPAELTCVIPGTGEAGRHGVEEPTSRGELSLVRLSELVA